MTIARERRSGHRGGVVLGLALTATGVWTTTTVAQSIAPAPGAPVHIMLDAADVTVVGGVGPDVRILPMASDNAASARAVLVRADPDGAVRLTRAPGVAEPQRPRIRVETPASAPLTVTLDQGDVRLDDLEGPVSVKVVRGSIRTKGLRGRVRLEVDTGDIAADAVRLAGAHSLKCRTFNGDVTVGLAAAPTDVRILALTLNGAVRSAVPLTTRAAFGPRFGEATIGAGTHVLSIDVVRGDVAIEREK